MKTVLKNCRVLGTTHDKDMLHDIYVENGIIEKIGLNLEVEGAKQIDVGGHTVMSGLIDMHCNICDPGHEYIPFASVSEMCRKNSIYRGYCNGFPCGTARRLYNDYLRTEYRPCY